MAATDHIVVFARAPVVGRVKTRLARRIGPERAALLYRAFVLDTLRALFAASAIPGTLACDPEPDEFLREAAAAWRLDVEPQRGTDIGERMCHAAALARSRGAARVLLIGTDIPTIPRALVHRALERLEEGRSVVLGPSFDGGYVLAALGPQADAAAVFAGVPWDGPEALAVTRENAARSGHRVAFVPTWYDIDEPADLDYLREHLAFLDPDDPSGAPQTRRLLASL
jgi:rSAM/selenodomain-associated transferase 1